MRLTTQDCMDLFRQTIKALSDLRDFRRSMRGSMSDKLPEEIMLEGWARYYSTGSTKE